MSQYEKFKRNQDLLRYYTEKWLSIPELEAAYGITASRIYAILAKAGHKTHREIRREILGKEVWDLGELVGQAINVVRGPLGPIVLCHNAGAVTRVDLFDATFAENPHGNP